VRLNLPNKKTRFFNGFVSRFIQTGFVLSNRKERLARYSATMVPWLWFLTRTADCRIYQDMTVPDIIKDVFKSNGFTDVDDALGGQYGKWEYCVQYRETAFNFVSRLMEQEGIYYYFKHEDGKHTIVLADPKSAKQPITGYEEIPFSAFDAATASKAETLWDWTIEQAVQPGLYEHTDFDFEKPGTSLKAKSKIERDHAMAAFEVFDYPGEYREVPEGEEYARARIEELQAQQEVCFGTSDARGLAAGFTFKVPNHPRADQNREYLVVSGRCRLQTDPYESSGEAGQVPTYTCDFSVMEATRPFRAPRVTPKPVVQGLQTAIVVGKQGEEIWTDKYGRIKVQFHWDRYGKSDEKSSCWVRVAQVWAGKGWGAVFTPRLGQEVIVEFLEGDPDLPLVTGSVYNGKLMPPYDLPANATISGVKSSSSKGGGGFNEIRFEDKKGDEQIFIHAQKNQDTRVEKDCFEWIGNNRHLIVKTDQIEHVENNRHEIVDADHMEEIGKDRHLEVKGKEAKEVTGSQSLTVGGDVNEVFKANHSEQVTSNYYLKGMGIVIEGATGVSLKCGSNEISISPGGISVTSSANLFLTGAMTFINSGPGPAGSPGSAGSAVTPAAPKEAEEADKADPGKVAEIKAQQKQTQTGKYGAVPVKPFKPPQTEEEKEKKSWIEIELVGEDNKPIPGEKYRIELPDGTVAEGTLDEKGMAHIEGTEKGTCQITFPDLDQDAWKKA